MYDIILSLFNCLLICDVALLCVKTTVDCRILAFLDDAIKLASLELRYPKHLLVIST